MSYLSTFQKYDNYKLNVYLKKTLKNKIFMEHIYKNIDYSNILWNKGMKKNSHPLSNIFWNKGMKKIHC